MRTKFRVLIVEDDAVSREATIQELELLKNGFEVEVIEATTLAEGIRQLPRAHCVLLDLSLPDSESPEDTCAAICDAMRHGKVPVVVYTASDDLNLWVMACRIVASAVVRKGDPLNTAIAAMFGIAQRHAVSDDRYREFLESAT